jgi:Glyoxalase/Bleomycin resistance protein/Dioxygenase superfamily
VSARRSPRRSPTRERYGSPTRGRRAFPEKLGFEKRREVPVPQFGGRWIEVAPAGATVTIALVPASESAPAGVQTGIRLTADDAAALHDGLKARGVEVGELLRWPGVPAMFEFHDQDGNRLEIVEVA